MAALHEQGRKFARVIAMDVDRVSRGRRKHLGDGMIQLFDHVQPLHVAFAQLRVAHDLRDDPVGVLDLLLDNADLLGRDRLALLERPLQREGRVVDDGERVLDLMRELGRHTPGGAQLAFAHGKLARFLHRPPLPFQQHLHAIAANGHQQQQRQAQRQGLGRILGRGVERQTLPRRVVQIVRWTSERRRRRGTRPRSARPFRPLAAMAGSPVAAWT